MRISPKPVACMFFISKFLWNMAEFHPPQNASEFAANFALIKPPMNDTEASYESARCLFCYDAPCVQACPTGIDIPLFIRQIQEGRPASAAKTIYQSNYFGHACGQVCPTEVLCEGSCVYVKQGVPAVGIGRLQSYATANVIARDQSVFRLAPNVAKKVAVIGAGPAGIACACELRAHGVQVDVFEAKARPSGLTVHGVAPYKITNEAALSEMDYLIRHFGLTMHYESPIASAEALQQLANDFDAVFVGIGLGETADIHIPGENIAGYHGAVEFIETLRMQQHGVQVPKTVVVLGGGNTAMDAASECARMGAERVVLAYRRSREEMGAYGFEFDLAKNVGVESLFNAAPLEVLGTDHVEGIRLVRTKTEHGRVVPIENETVEIACDWVIKATGQTKQTGWLAQISGLATDSSGRIQVNADFQTTNPQFFAGGDAVNGGKEVVNAAADGKAAALGMLKWWAAQA